MSIGCGGWIWTTGLQVMGLTSYQAALPRDNFRLDYHSRFKVIAQGLSFAELRNLFLSEVIEPSAEIAD
jgi:hypothetical protein